jgi:hypothetical protein
MEERPQAETGSDNREQGRIIRKGDKRGEIGCVL